MRADENGTEPERVHPSGAANAAANATWVALAFSSAANAPNTGAGSEPSSGSTSSNTISPSVSVPVLSRHTTSTRARPSTAGSSCTNTLRRANVTAATMNATLVSNTRPFGHHPHDPGDRATQRFVELVVAELTPDEQRRRRDQHPRDDAEDRVDALHQLGAGELEPTGLGRQLPRVRVAADTGGLEAAGTRDHEAAGQHLVVGRLVERVALTGEQRLVDLETARRPDHAVTRDLVARPQLEQLVDDDVLDRDVADLVVAHDAPGVR